VGREHLPPRGRLTNDQLTVCYDGECAVCAAAVERLAKLDRDRSLRIVPFQRVAGELPDVAARIDAADLTSALHVVEPDGRLTSGGEAVLRIAEAVPRLRLVARLGRLPLVSRLVEPMYGLVARHRHRLSRMLRPAG